MFRIMVRVKFMWLGVGLVLGFRIRVIVSLGLVLGVRVRVTVSDRVSVRIKF